MRALLTVIVLVCSMTTTVHAQFALPALQTPLQFVLDPVYPKPGDDVKVTLRSYGLDVAASDVGWYVAGELVAAGAGLTTITTNAEDLGVEKVVSVIVRPDATTEVFDEVVIRPVALDLLWEADTYTPALYRGRALPSPDAHIRAEARAYFVRADGSRVADRDIVYTWRINNKVIASVSGRGKGQAILPAPRLFANDTLSVDAVSVDGVFRAEAKTFVPGTEPRLVLYQEDPLNGLMLSQSLGTAAAIPDSEVTVAVLPYFSLAKHPGEPQLEYQWKVNGKILAADPTDPFRLLVRLTEGSQARASVELFVDHTQSLFQAVSEKWTLTLNGVGRGTGSGNPFFAQPVE